MSELKSYKMVEEKYCTDCVCVIPSEVYIKSEADAVLAAKDAEIRRLKRALWMHRAITAKLNKEGCKAMREYNPFVGIEEYNWQEIERKCRSKAEEYR